MVYGMKLNAYKNCIGLIMQNKTVISGLIVFGFSLFIGVAAGADEVLGHISDETEPKVQQPQTAESQNSDRKIIYRVICSPDDEQLPDCEKPFHDVEADNKPQPSPESSDQANDAENPEHSEAEDKPLSVKPTLKAANKKQDKSSKKPVGKKDKQVSKSSATQKAGKKDSKKTAVKKSSVKKK